MYQLAGEIFKSCINHIYNVVFHINVFNFWIERLGCNAIFGFLKSLRNVLDRVSHCLRQLKPA